MVHFAAPQPVYDLELQLTPSAECTEYKLDSWRHQKSQGARICKKAGLATGEFRK
jgi:hypothetical protein